MRGCGFGGRFRLGYRLHGLDVVSYACGSETLERRRLRAADLPLPFPLKRQQGIRVRLDKRLRPAEAPHHAYECDGAASSLCASMRCGGRCTGQLLRR